MSHRFTVEQFSPLIYGSGAEKLVDSQIAPLIAAVRGYRSFSEQDGESKKAQTRFAEATKPVRSGGRGITSAQTKDCFMQGGDVMMMPWYNIGTVITGGTKMPGFSLCQARPSIAKEDSSGRPMKYLFPKEMSAPISAHPAWTGDLAAGASRIIITEGVLKEDSLLTAMIMNAGIPFTELLLPSGLSADEVAEWAKDAGLAQLRELIEKVPSSARLLPVGVAGVDGWRPTQLSPINFTGKELLICLDGDVASNPRVWKAASRLWEYASERDAQVRLVNLGSSAALMQIQSVDGYSHIGKAAGEKKPPMLGADDFLSHIGTLSDLLSYIEDQLPPAPHDEGLGMKGGEWYVAKDGLSVGEWVYSSEHGGSLMPRVMVGGRVSSIVVDRLPTHNEVQEGNIHASEDRSAVQRAILELSWLDESTDQVRTVNVELGTEMLNSPPDRWPAKVYAQLPPDLTMSPNWPPPGGEKGMKWLQAIKRNSATENNEWTQKRSWSATGWVPTVDGDPVYVIGDNRLGATRADEEQTLSAVDESILPNSRDFGVDDRWWSDVDPNGVGEVSPEGLEVYKKRLRNDIELVVKHFVNSGVWRTAHHGPALLAAALRTTVPKRPGIPIFCSGNPGSGKSWSASFAMCAWQSRKKVWSEDHLPGSASSTAFALEKTVAVAGGGLWVVDDLAPSVSQSAAINAEAGMENLVRSIFNDSARQRGTKDGGLAQSSQPRAMLMVTAENSLTSTSALERIVELRFERGMGDSKTGTMNNDAANVLREEVLHTLSLSRVAAAMVRFWHQPHLSTSPESSDTGGYATTWKERMEELERSVKSAKSALSILLEAEYGIAPGASARRVNLISELLLPLVYLARLYAWAEGSDSDTNVTLAVLNAPSGDSGQTAESAQQALHTYKQISAAVSAINANRVAEHGEDAPPMHNVTVALAELAAEQLGKLQEHKVGRSLIVALSNALASRKAHLTNPITPGIPPFDTSNAEGQHYNRLVGWEIEGSEWRPKGEPIGCAGILPDGEKPLIAQFHAVNAFALAQKHYPTFVPHGQKFESSWRAALSEGLLIEPKGGKRSYSVQQYYGSGARVRGPMVLLNRLLGINEEIEE